MSEAPWAFGGVISLLKELTVPIQSEVPVPELIVAMPVIAKPR